MTQQHAALDYGYGDAKPEKSPAIPHSKPKGEPMKGVVSFSFGIRSFSIWVIFRNNSNNGRGNKAAAAVFHDGPALVGHCGNNINDNNSGI